MNSLSSCPHFVYELLDPRDNSTFYVGITVNLLQRYKQHMSLDGSNPAKDARVQEILASGHLPPMRTIEQVGSLQEALERESYWIHRYIGQGIALLNIAGVHVASPESRQAQRASSLPVPQGFVRYSSDRFLTKLYFYALDGEFVSFERATSEQFLGFICQYVRLDHETLNDLDYWSITGCRCKVLNFARIAGIHMEYYNAQGEPIVDQIGNPFR